MKFDLSPRDVGEVLRGEPVERLHDELLVAAHLVHVLGSSDKNKKKLYFGDKTLLS